METAYDPSRIHQLSMRTAMAIDALAMFDSPDPMAADAMRALRLLRRNLEDVWMPLLRQIETSQALISWTSTAAISAIGFLADGREAIAAWIERHTHDLAEHLRSMSDDEFLVRLAHIGEDGLPFDGYNGLDLDDPSWTAMFPTVAAEMAFRVRVDPTFRSRLVEVSYDNPAVGLAISYANFPTTFVHEVAVNMLHRPSRMDDFETRAEAAAASAALEALVVHPQVCLTTMQDPTLLAELAGWTMLDQDVVARFVQSGLHTAVVESPRRLAEGYSVIGELTRLANGSFDGGFTVGMSRGVARSMIGYVDTLGRSIDKEDGGQVRVTTLGAGTDGPRRDDGFAIELGTYEDVRNLFGAMARDVEAQAALGVVLGAYMNTVVADVGGDLATLSGVDHVAQFADLLGDAVTAEQAEMIATAASATAQNGILVGAVGFATSKALSFAGAGPFVGYVAGRLVKSASERMADVEPQEMPNGRLRHVAHDAIVVASVTLARTDRELQAARGLDGDDAASLAQIDVHLARLAEFDAAGNDEAYRDEVSDMVDFIEQRAPQHDAFLTEIRSIPAVNELVEGHG